MIDMNHADHGAYERPALVRLGALVDVADELRKIGVDGNFQVAWTRIAPGVWQDESGNVYDFSNGRTS